MPKTRSKAKPRPKTSIAAEVREIIDSYSANVTGIICMLQDIQARYTHLPKEALIVMSKELGIPLSRLFSLATFYKAFTLNPRGKHLVTVCMGTACHVRGASRLSDEIQRKLGIKAGETTPDGNFTLDLVNCLGACALGPLLVINGEYYGKMNSKKVGTILNKYKTKGK